jgi:hypothetical protein
MNGPLVVLTPPDGICYCPPAGFSTPAGYCDGENTSGDHRPNPETEAGTAAIGKPGLLVPKQGQSLQAAQASVPDGLERAGAAGGSSVRCTAGGASGACPKADVPRGRGSL